MPTVQYLAGWLFRDNIFREWWNARHDPHSDENHLEEDDLSCIMLEKHIAKEFQSTNKFVYTAEVFCLGPKDAQQLYILLMTNNRTWDGIPWAEVPLPHFSSDQPHAMEVKEFMEKDGFDFKKHDVKFHTMPWRVY
ncbi:hypothetical protein EW026_g6539 [Hermanssonia centrifuga]|uniref:Uncharacterized protein n=1 Tax=Hermanssonia centrifuga TaxID=98765 RepID=A0A4S4KF27_9APHY|nr:hypothetical protein EW026_g6539 [Hermanssonia centrifuga]